MNFTHNAWNTHKREIAGSKGSIDLNRGGGIHEDVGSHRHSLENVVREQFADPQEARDQKKYDKARNLATYLGKIREQYRMDFKSDEDKIRQRAVALYFIDILGIRVGNRKKEGDTSETAGCCSLRKKHLKLYGEKNNHMVEFDFLGKGSIRYSNKISVDEIVYSNLQRFLKNKSDEGYVFDLLRTTHLNTYLKTFMDGLTAKVFRTYHACRKMQQELDNFICAKKHQSYKISYCKDSIKSVAIFLNHQQAVTKKGGNKEFETSLTSAKLYYIDPRIVVGWCTKWCVPIEKIYSTSQRGKLLWAMTAEADYDFLEHAI
ncbi:DNA topoisomerase 1-like [Crassostrea angulata]|uniref:DNA topoisomerase 1-like n=1 Tax=Magallana angulata TaxID=2784310 RepID=UPI0022B0BB5B|nr:DNA topoisomerase 1-like [Crassostrea angulata]